MQNAIRSVLKNIVIGSVFFTSFAALSGAAYAQTSTENALNSAAFGD